LKSNRKPRGPSWVGAGATGGYADFGAALLAVFSCTGVTEVTSLFIICPSNAITNPGIQQRF
jgi:hypothetical protein